MGWDADRKLDAAGLGLAAIVLLSVGLLGFGAMQATSDDRSGTPDVEWSIERVGDSDVRIQHAGGDTVYGDEITVTVDGRERPPIFDGVVRPGDSATITVSQETTVSVHWTGGTGDREPMESERV